MSFLSLMECPVVNLHSINPILKLTTTLLLKLILMQSKWQCMRINFPNTIQLGDVSQINSSSLNQKIDLLIGGGSPCQGFSSAGKQLNFNDERSKLFFEYVRILKELNPKYFLLENVKMKKEFQDVISNLLGVEPIQINSSLVSAQNRLRNYWTNIPNISLPEDRNIQLNDILELDLPPM